MKIIIAYLSTAAVFLAVDFLWLSYMARSFYAAQLGPLLLERPNISAAAVFYLAYAAGIVFFAVAPALRAESAAVALGHGAVLGLLAYATYDVTNYATLRNWPLAMSVVDVVWGGVLTSLAAFAGYAAAVRFAA